MVVIEQKYIKHQKVKLRMEIKAGDIVVVKIKMCNPGRGATGLRARYRREGRDWRNNYWYSCWNWRRGWSSFATYNANTLNRAQKRYARRWGSARNYACAQGCGGYCYRRGALRNRADRIFAGYTAGRSTSSKPALIRYGSGNNWTMKGNRGSITVYQQ